MELTGSTLSQPQRFDPIAIGSWPGQFRINFGQLAEGRYQARVIGAADDPAAVAAFDVRGNLEERLNVASRPDLLQLIATGSGGGVLESSEPQELGRRIRDDLAAIRLVAALQADLSQTIACECEFMRIDPVQYARR